MPLFLISARRKIEVAQTGDFVIEASGPTEARQKAANDLACALLDIEWANVPDAQKNAQEISAEIVDVELLADGDEDIREPSMMFPSSGRAEKI